MVSESENRSWLLKFISGKYQGQEFLLEEGHEYLIGRSHECDLVVVEDMVSRQHAKVFVKGGQPMLQDLNSTNGSFVNGERVNAVELREGDRILFGTSIIKLISRMKSREASGPSPAAQAVSETSVVKRLSDPSSSTGPQVAAAPRKPAPATQAMGAIGAEALLEGAGVDQVVKAEPEAEAANEKRTMTGAMTGDLKEVPLPDLLMLFSSARKNGTVQIKQESGREATLYLRNGDLTFVSINGEVDVDPEKVAYRVLTWEAGEFAFHASSEVPTFENEIEIPTQSLMMEAMRLHDEIGNLGELPDHDAVLTIKRPLTAPLRDLTPEQLDSLQMVINYGMVETILNKSESSDLEALSGLRDLIKGDYVEHVS